MVGRWVSGRRRRWSDRERGDRRPERMRWRSNGTGGGMTGKTLGHPIIGISRGERERRTTDTKRVYERDGQARRESARERRTDTEREPHFSLPHSSHPYVPFDRRRRHRCPPSAAAVFSRSPARPPIRPTAPGTTIGRRRRLSRTPPPWAPSSSTVGKGKDARAPGGRGGEGRAAAVATSGHRPMCGGGVGGCKGITGGGDFLPPSPVYSSRAHTAKTGRPDNGGGGGAS